MREYLTGDQLIQCARELKHAPSDTDGWYYHMLELTVHMSLERYHYRWQIKRPAGPNVAQVYANVQVYNPKETYERAWSHLESTTTRNFLGTPDRQSLLDIVHRDIAYAIAKHYSEKVRFAAR